MTSPQSTADGAALGQPLGQLLGTYGKSRSFLLVGYLMAAMFILVGAFVLYLPNTFGPDVRFDGDISLLYKVGGVSVALGVAIAVLFQRLGASQPLFQLYENGIRASGRDGERITMYRDLEDLFNFFYGGIGYRASPQVPWTFIGSRIHKFAELSQQLRRLQVEHRIDLLHQRIKAGQPVVFRYFEDKVARSKSLVASRNMDYPTHEIVVSGRALQIEGKSIELARIADIQTNNWVETSSIVDVDGKVFHKIHPSAILSFDLLYCLIAELRDTTPAPENDPAY